MEKFCPTAIFLAILLLTLVTLESRVEATGVIRTIYIGDCFMRPGFPTPGLVEDPKISLTRIVGEIGFVDEKEMTRAMRIYLPRTSKHLSENFDLIVLSAFKSNSLAYAFNKWIADGVLAGDLAFLIKRCCIHFLTSSCTGSLNPQLSLLEGSQPNFSLY